MCYPQITRKRFCLMRWIKRLRSCILFVTNHLHLIFTKRTFSSRLLHNRNFDSKGWRTSVIGVRRFLDAFLRDFQNHLLCHLFYHPIPLNDYVLLHAALGVHFVSYHECLLGYELIYQLLKYHFILFLQSFLSTTRSRVAGTHARVVFFVAAITFGHEVYCRVLYASVYDTGRKRIIHICIVLLY